MTQKIDTAIGQALQAAGEPGFIDPRMAGAAPECPECGTACAHTDQEKQGFAMDALQQASEGLARDEAACRRANEADRVRAGLEQQAPGQLATLAGILAEFDLFKENYANDSLVQAMAAQLELLQSQVGHGTTQVASTPPKTEEVRPDVVTAMSGYLRVCRSGGMPSKQADLVQIAVAEAQHLGYFVTLAEQPGIDSSDRERLLYVARVLRAIADLDRDAKLGNLWSEAVVSVGTIKRVLNIKDDDCAALGLTAASMSDAAVGAEPRVSKLLDGWKEAAIAWEVCGSIHKQWAKGKDALFTTRQGDFVRHAEVARTKYRTLLGNDQDTVTG